MYVCMYVCMCVCMSVRNGLTIEIYGFTQSLRTSLSGDVSIAARIIIVCQVICMYMLEHCGTSLSTSLVAMD